MTLSWMIWWLWLMGTQELRWWFAFIPIVLLPAVQVVAVCQEAGMNVLRENIDARCMHQCHFLQALTVVKPKTNKDLLTLYERYNNNDSQ